jgi:hypothetical protein
VYAGKGTGGDIGLGTMSFGCGRDGANASTVGDDKGLGELVVERVEDPVPSQVGGASMLGVGLGNVGMTGLVAVEPNSEGGGDSEMAGEAGTRSSVVV